MFTFRTLYPAQLSQSQATADIALPESAKYWKLISSLSAEEISAMLLSIRLTWGIIFGVGSLVGIVLSFFYARFRVQQISARHQIEFLASRDSLTGIYNRRHFEQRVEEEIARGTRYGHSMAFLMIDVTRSKQINDNHGHAVGDQVLARIAGILCDSVRTTDIVVRLRGDEFLIMSLETGREATSAHARIEAAIAGLNCSGKFAFPIVLAMGSAVWTSEASTSIDDGLRQADEHMYEQKKVPHDAADPSPRTA